MHTKTWIYSRQIFPSAARLTGDTLETIWGAPRFPQIWGTITDMGKILLGLCSQNISRKSHGSIPKKFQAVWYVQW